MGNNFPSGHMTSKLRRTDVDATSLRRIDVPTMSLRRHVFATSGARKHDLLAVFFFTEQRLSELGFSSDDRWQIFKKLLI